MNKILVVDNKFIPYDGTDIIIGNNTINFINNGNYYIEYIDCNDISININVQNNVCINLFEYSDNDDIKINNKYILNKNSSLILSKFYYNASSDEKIDIYLKEDRANIKYNFSSINSGNNKHIVNIYHEGNNTSSDIFNKVVANNDSLNIFDINSYVENGIKNCYLNQQTKILTLGVSNNKINPNMFIGEESTTATHSSVIGSISEDDLFYLMSRGISYNDSINLIVKGMILSNINATLEIRAKILKILDNIGGE